MPTSRLASVARRLLIAALVVAGVLAWNDHRAVSRVDTAAYRAGEQAALPAFEAAQAAATSAPPIGWVDVPAVEAVVDTRFTISGWALDADGIARVEVRVDGKPYAARYGIVRLDVAAAKPGYPDSAAAGFEFSADFANLDPVRHALSVVAIGRSGRETVLARKSLIPPQAMVLWSDLLERHPALAKRPFRFLMMTSGVASGGAAETDIEYQAYVSRTMGIGIAVPILYLRTTRGASGDWVFDPDFDLTRKCGDRPVADDNLNDVIRFAVARRVPVQFILNGGIWADASCDTPEWDVNDHLEQDIANCQWTQDDVVFPDDYLKKLTGSAASPELARALTYNVYAAAVRHYKRRNLQAAARIIAEFARAHPDLFAGVALDSDTYMNPFFAGAQWFDYNPGMLKQFRQWLAGAGPYAGAPEPGTPDLTRFRRARALTLADVNRLANRRWLSWDEVDPPRTFPGSARDPPVPGRPAIWDDPWYQEWETFRKHVVGLHYDELAQWVHAAGIPRDKIFSAQGFVAPAPGVKPFAIHVNSHGQNYDSAGVSIEGAIPRAGHLGAIIYGDAAENRVRMEEQHSLFATFARMDPRWAAVELNNADLNQPTARPTYAQSYRSFRDLFNLDAQEVSVMAWNGSNGIYAGLPGYLAYTSWRNTPAEDAMRDFLVAHADLPLGARLWTFGVPGYADDDGWSLERGTLVAQGGHIDLEFDAATATLVSPGDQVIRAANIDFLVLGLRDPASLAAVQVFGRVDAKAPWVAVGASIPAPTLVRNEAGVRVPLAWPRAWRDGRTIVSELKVALSFDRGTTRARLDRIALYPQPAASLATR